MLFFLHQPFGLHPDHIESPYPVQFLLHGFLQSQQAALSQPAVQKGEDADKGILADKAFLNALVVKDTKRLIEKPLSKQPSFSVPSWASRKGAVRSSWPMPSAAGPDICSSSSVHRHSSYFRPAPPRRPVEWLPGLFGHGFPGSWRQKYWMCPRASGTGSHSPACLIPL